VSDDHALARLDATAQAELVRQREITPEELTEAALSRIGRLDPQLNAVIHDLSEKAHASIAAGLPDGPLRGVPFLVKDAVCQTAGDPYHAGMSFLKERGYVAKHDTELARRFRAAGLVFVGKTNTPELAMSATTEPRAYGPTHNPWRRGLSPGGSSGGSAAAVAAGLVPAAHGNDMGGSIRVPASFCGLVGLKPSRARSTLAPELGEFWGPLTHEHVLTRTVRDSAAILDAIAGPAPGDPYSAPPPVRPFAEEVGADPGRLRVGLVTGLDGCAIHADCVAAVEQSGRVLESLGHHVEVLRYDEISQQAIGPWIPAGIARDLDRWSAVTGDPIGQDDVEPFNWMMAEMGRSLNGPQFMALAEAAFAWARTLQAPFVAGLDVVLTPTVPTPPPEHGWMSPDVSLPELSTRLAGTTLFTMPFDITGQPAMSLPLAMSADGLPVGVQLVAPMAREDRLLRLAAQLETAWAWAERRPPLHA
jgi:amidase